ncbi:maleylacetate reductase [Streptomyces sp. NPDC001982]|uniref:maleylacetate reductase n=1 Tax=unclassified Streptomyces TaxID=2593676 RepID=UPI003321EF69
MDGFVHQGQITRVVFGSGTRLRIAEEVSALGCRRAVVLSTPGQAIHAADVQELLVDMAAGAFTEAAMHTPSHITGAAVRFVGAQRADCLVSVGGGSAIGLGKAVSLRTGLPHIALPTTYAGSEMSPILGETDGERKTTRRLPEVRLRTVVYDVDLTVTLPPGTAAASGLNALAHAVEALYARDRDPLAFLMAGEAITALTAHLPVIVERPDDLEARRGALYGAWLAGACLGTVGMALHHKICHVLGGTFALPHAATHAVVLPYVVAFNAPSAPRAMRRIGTALPAADPATGLYEFAGRLGVPRSLRELGMPESGIEAAADRVLEDGYWNPRPVDRRAATGILTRAWHGDAPAG